MRHSNSSLPLALLLAAAVQTPGTILPDVTNASRPLLPGVLSPLMERPAAIGSASEQLNYDQPGSQQRTAQRFLNFLNCSGGRRC